MSRKIIFIYFIIGKFLFSNFNNDIEILKIIKKNPYFTCNINLKTIRLEGENFIGNYYNKKPYGLWELKDKSIKQCFSYDENQYYKKDEYYIVDNKFYYMKYSYVNYNYILEDKKNKEMYIIKKNSKDIINDNNSNQKYIPKPMYEFIYIETESDRKILPDFIFDEEWKWSNENVEVDIKIIK